MFHVLREAEMTDKVEVNDRSRGRFSATINAENVSFSDPKPDVRQLLNAVGFEAASDCILIQVFAHGTRSIGLDEHVNLREVGVERFWAFKADRIYRFTVDERGFEWGAATISEPVLRSIAHVEDDEVIILERQDEPDDVLRTENEVRLADAGTEHLRIEKRNVTVFFKEIAISISRGVYTTEQLIALFPIEEGYLLNLLSENGELVTLKPHQKIWVKDGMHFYSQVPGGGAS
jgi:hypothetical protein